MTEFFDNDDKNIGTDEEWAEALEVPDSPGIVDKILKTIVEKVGPAARQDAIAKLKLQTNPKGDAFGGPGFADMLRNDPSLKWMLPEDMRAAISNTYLRTTELKAGERDKIPPGMSYEQLLAFMRSRENQQNQEWVPTNAAPPNANILQAGDAQPNVTKNDFQARNGLVNSAIAAGANAADKFQRKGAADFLLGGDTANWRRDFIGYDDPNWHKPAGILDIMRSMVEVSDPTLNAFGQVAKAGNIARTQAAEAAQLERELSVLEENALAKSATAQANLLAAQAPPDLTGPTLTAIQESGLQNSALSVINKYMQLIDSPGIGGKVGGLPQAAWSALKKTGTALGFDMGETVGDAAKNMRAHLFQSLVPVLGDRFNKKEFNEAWDAILKKPGMWSSDTALYNQLKRYRESLESQLEVNSSIILRNTRKPLGEWLNAPPLISSSSQGN